MTVERRSLEAIESEAEGVLRALGKWRLPVDPFEIAADEEIELESGAYGPDFDGRIKFLKEIGSFVIHYTTAGSVGRRRFTLSHELAHYYLHRDMLIDGHPHHSLSDFRSSNPIEQEADDFAAALLMPRDLFVAEVRRFRGRVCTLKEICQLADERVMASVTSTIRRYCRCDVEPAMAIFSVDGRAKWAVFSAGMKALGMWYVEFGKPLPRSSQTASLWNEFNTSGNPDMVSGEVCAKTWFKWPKRPLLWEEAMLLGNTGVVVTFLTLPL